MKKITISSKPTAKVDHQKLDAWVDGRSSTAEPTKRLTIDVPLSLHQRVKSQCALKGENMADVIRELLERHFDPEYEGRGVETNSGSH